MSLQPLDPQPNKQQPLSASKLFGATWVRWFDAVRNRLIAISTPVECDWEFTEDVTIGGMLIQNGGLAQKTTDLLNDNYTVLDTDYRIDFKITTAVTYRVTLPDPTDSDVVNRILVIDNHYASQAGSLVDFSRAVDGVAAGSSTLAPDNSLKIMSDGFAWRSTV